LSSEAEGSTATAISRGQLGGFGQVEIEVPRARLKTPRGTTTEWKSKPLRAHQRRTLVADALIASTPGTHTRPVLRALCLRVRLRETALS
jgi:putative transposase